MTTFPQPQHAIRSKRLLFSCWHFYLDPSNGASITSPEQSDTNYNQFRLYVTASNTTASAKTFTVFAIDINNDNNGSVLVYRDADDTITDTITFNPGDSGTKYFTVTVTNAHAGDNWIFRGHYQNNNSGDSGGSGGVPLGNSHRDTQPLTVWRRLWVECDQIVASAPAGPAGIPPTSHAETELRKACVELEYYSNSQTNVAGQDIIDDKMAEIRTCKAEIDRLIAETEELMDQCNEIIEQNPTPLPSAEQAEYDRLSAIIKGNLDEIKNNLIPNLNTLMEQLDALLASLSTAREIPSATQDFWAAFIIGAHQSTNSHSLGFGGGGDTIMIYMTSIKNSVKSTFPQNLRNDNSVIHFCQELIVLHELGHALTAPHDSSGIMQQGGPLLDLYSDENNWVLSTESIKAIQKCVVPGSGTTIGE